MRSFLSTAACLLFWLPVVAVQAQTLPFHLDLSAREDVPDLSALPAVRFLTTQDFPPFNYRDARGDLVGFHVDLARAICDDLKIVCTIQSWPWDQVADALADNQGDALIGGLALTDETGARFDFTSIYLGLPARFVTTNENAAAFDPLRPGLRVAMRQGSAHAEFVRRYLSAPELMEAETETAALDLTRTGEADAFFGDAMRASFWLNQNPECCGFAGEPYFRPDLFGHGFAIAVPAGRDIVRTAFDASLVRLKRNGKLDELFLRWFPVSFY